MECSRLRSRWFRAMAVTELAQQDVSRTDYRAHFRLDTYRPAAPFSTPSRPFRRGFQRVSPADFEILGAPRVIRMGPLVANIDGAHLTRRDRERGPSARLRRAPCDKNRVWLCTRTLSAIRLFAEKVWARISPRPRLAHPVVPKGSWTPG